MDRYWMIHDVDSKTTVKEIFNTRIDARKKAAEMLRNAPNKTLVIMGTAEMIRVKQPIPVDIDPII